MRLSVIHIFLSSDTLNELAMIRYDNYFNARLNGDLKICSTKKMVSPSDYVLGDLFLELNTSPCPYQLGDKCTMGDVHGPEPEMRQDARMELASYALLSSPMLPFLFHTISCKCFEVKVTLKVNFANIKLG